MAYSYFVPPIDIDDTKLVSSTIAEDDAPAFVDSDTYNTDDRVMSDHYIWDALKDGVTSKPGVVKDDWSQIKPTNQYSMFTYRSGFITEVQDEDLVVVIKPNDMINMISFIGVQCSSIHIKMDDPIDGEVFNETIEMADVAVDNWYDYFYKVSSYKSNLFVRIPSFYDTPITITLASGGGTVKCTALILGQLEEIGVLMLGASGGITDYSTKEIDPTYGVYTVVERIYTRNRSFRLEGNVKDMQATEDKLAKVRAKPCLFVGSEQNEWAMVFGIYKDFDQVMGNQVLSKTSLELEGLMS